MIQAGRQLPPHLDAASIERPIFALGRLHIVAIGSLACLTFSWLFSGRHLWLCAAFAAVDWFLVNFLNRTVDLLEDQRNAIPGVAFASAHRRKMVIFGGALLFLSLPLSAAISAALTSLRSAFHLLGLAYNWPVLPHFKRLKELYFLKNLASAIGFQLTVIGYPLAMMGFDLSHSPAGIRWATVAWSMAFLLLFTLSYEIIYDLRDLEGDKAAGVRTYPVVHGTRFAMLLIDLLILGSVAVAATGYLLGHLPWRIFVMVIAPLLQFALYKRALRRSISGSFCTHLTWLGAALFLLYNLWVALGLPLSL